MRNDYTSWIRGLFKRCKTSSKLNQWNLPYYLAKEKHNTSMDAEKAFDKIQTLS